MKRVVTSKFSGYKFIPRERFAEYNESLKSRKPLPVKGDGHCLIYSITECMNQYQESHNKFTVSDILNELKNEIERDRAFYRGFMPLGVNMYRQMELFETNRVYNLEICDTFLLAFCNIYKVEIVVTEGTIVELPRIIHVVKPSRPVSESSPRRILFLQKTGDHYDPLLNQGGYLSSSVCFTD